MSSFPEPACQQRIAGSFRDPSGYVFARQGRIFRAIDGECRETLQGLVDCGLWAKLLTASTIVRTEFVADKALEATLAGEHSGFDQFLEHEVLWPITYPYEWSISMLADAAVHTLDLQLKLLEAGYSLKDATAYNIQFVAGRPQFIDVASIERPKRLDLWFALGQFQQMFVFPLLLARHYGWDLRSYFLANLGGRPVEQVLRGFTWLERLRPRLLLDVTLPALLTRWADKGDRARREVLETRHENRGPQIANLKRLRSKVLGLAAGYRPQGVWAEYTQICNYDEEAEQAKKALVRQFLEATRPQHVLDLGCNTGDYSRLAVETGAQVIAVDADHDAIELLYRQLRAKSLPITPMVVDLGNPSPGLGYMNRERAAFLERVDCDCVLALALLHHLLVSANLSLAAAAELLASLTRRDLVLEFIPPDDNMFQRLMKFRVNLFENLTLAQAREAFGRYFRMLKEEPIPGSKRTLLFLQKTTSG